MSSNGNPLLPAPPTTVVVADLVNTEVDPRQKAKLESLGRNDAGEANSFWASLWASVQSGVGVVATEFANDLDIVLAFVGKFFLLGQGEKNSAFYDLAGTILEDLTGVPVDKAALKASTFGSGRLAGMTTFGADLYNTLAAEFAPKTGDLETPDATPAQAFLGFLMNFAIRQGNIELLTTLLPESWRIGEGYRAYGELMAKNLGLGRMARRALQPLIQTLVADPLQYQLNAQYHPKRLAKEQAIKAFFRGVIDLTQLRKELSEEGYSDARQDFMLDDSRPIPSDREIIRLLFRGKLNDTDANKELSARGLDANGIYLATESERPQLTSQEILELYIFGQTDRVTATTNLQGLGYDATTAENLTLLAEMKAGVVRPKQPRHLPHRTFNQLRKEYIDGVIDLNEWNTQLTLLGYNVDDIAAMTQDLLIDAAKGKTTGSKRAIPSLTWAQLKEAYKVGILTLDETTAHLTHRGYSTDDIAILIKELPAPPAPPAPTVP
jgi:hypothetical protein